MRDDINGLRSNIARLIALYEAEKQRADSLAAKLSVSEGEVLKYKEQITDLNLQIDNQRLMSAWDHWAPAHPRRPIMGALS